MRAIAILLLAITIGAAEVEPAPKLDRVTLSNGGVVIGSITEDADGYAVLVGGGKMHLARDAVKGIEKGVADVPADGVAQPSTQSDRKIKKPAPNKPFANEAQYRAAIEAFCDSAIKIAEPMLATLTPREEIKDSDTVGDRKAKDARNQKRAVLEQLQIRVRELKEGRTNKVPYLLISKRAGDVMEHVIIIDQELYGTGADRAR